MKIPIDPLSLVPLTSVVFSAWAKTLRMECHGDFQSMLDLQQKGQPFIIALWHGELFPLIAIQFSYDLNLAIMVSQSKDGEFIARLLEGLGHKTVRGSSSRGGVRALLQAKRLMEREKRIGCFTVDGPRGPRHNVKDGVIYLAQKAGAKILPMRAYVEKCKVFDSWDKFILPYPFSKYAVHVGTPMDVPTEKLDKESMKRERERLETRLNELGPKV